MTTSGTPGSWQARFDCAGVAVEHDEGAAVGRAEQAVAIEPQAVRAGGRNAKRSHDLALELGRELGVPLPTTAVTNELLTAAGGMGVAEKDFAVLFDVLAAMAGVPTTTLP
jgi:hypothetical protein